MSTMETFKATTQILKGGLAVESSSRNFKIVLDEPKSLGGTDKGMNPVELQLCALGGCQAIVAKAFAKHKGIDLKDFRVELEGDLDVRGFRGDPNVRPGFQEIRFTMYMKTDASPEKAREFAEFIERTCPVGVTITNGVTLKLGDVVVEKP